MEGKGNEHREKETEREKERKTQSRKHKLVLEGLVSHPVLVYPGCTLGSRPCLFIVAGLELILPISFWDRTRCVCLIYLFIRLHIFLYLLSLFFFNARLQMRVCTEQIRHTQPRTEGTKSTRNKKVERGRNSPKGDNKTYSVHAFRVSYIKLYKI